MESLNLPLTIKVFKEGTSKGAPYVAFNPEFDVSSCGKTDEEARKMLEEAIFILLKGSREDGTFEQLMEEAGFGSSKASSPKTYISVLNISLPKVLAGRFSYA